MTTVFLSDIQLIAKAANTVLAGPSSGVSAAPTFRSLVAADLLSLDQFTLAAADVNINTHKLTNVVDPTNPQDCATRNYVDQAVAAIQAKNDVQAATIAALPAATYNNGSSGVGATLTGNVAAVLVLDGYTPALNSRILVKNESNAATNGIYSLTTLGTVIVQWVLTRTLDFDQPTDGINGALVYILNGTTNSNTLWSCTTDATIVFGTTNINWAQFLGTTYTADESTLHLSGTTFSIKSGYLAASATTDTTNAANITSGTLPNARLVAVPNSALANSSVIVTAGTGLSTGGSVSLGSSVTLNLSTSIPQAETLTLTNATTNAADAVLTLSHNSSGTPATNFGLAVKYQLADTTTSDVDAGNCTVTWATATHASRKARVVHNIFDTAVREYLRGEASGSAPMIGFLGASASAALASPDLGTLATTFGLATGTPTFAGANVTGTVPLATSAGTCTGNAATATALATARAINGTNFDGTAAITVTAAAGTLTGTTLNSTVVTSSLTSVGTLTGLTEIVSDAATNATSTGAIFGHNTSGTAAAGFGSVYKLQLQDSTTASTDAGDVTVTWATATHASRKARVVFNVYDTAIREYLRGEASGTAPMIGFLGASASAALASPDLATLATTFGLATGSPTLAESKLTLTDITTNNVSTSNHGFAPKLPNDATKYMDGTGAYSVPAGSAKLVQRLYTEYTSNADLTTNIPDDDTIPQNTEGVQILSQAITPVSGSNNIRVMCFGFGSCGTGSPTYAGGDLTMALYQDSTANALAATTHNVTSQNVIVQLSLVYEASASNTTARTYKIRVGVNTGTARMNGNIGARYFGGCARTVLIVEEVAP